jgi:Ankyrin repeats (3 copies)
VLTALFLVPKVRAVIQPITLSGIFNINMPHRRRAKPVTALVPHRTPNLVELLEAAKQCDDIDAMRRFLAAGGLPDALVELKYSDATSTLGPLIFRAISLHTLADDPADHHDTLELLLQAGASANAISIDAGRHHLPVRMLLAHNADVCLQTADGETALHSAATAGNLNICMMLLEAGRGAGLGVRDSRGSTPLINAVDNNHLPVVELLHKQYGADITASDRYGTLLHSAAATCQRPLIDIYCATAWTLMQ